MHRREFLVRAGCGVGTLLTGCTTSRSGKQAAADIYRTLVRQNDARIPDLLARQDRSGSDRARGGIPDRYGLYHAGAAAGFIRDLTAAHVCPESRYAGNVELIEPMRRAARFLRRVQHEDGTIDLLTTNFHSPPDTAFVLEPLTLAIRVLRGSDRRALGELLGELEAFARRGAQALVAGGIHTPNHRWVISRALARAHVLFPDPRYVARIDEWLGEGIDIDPDGQFTERSTSIYSPLTDHCLMTIARLLDRPALLDPVRRNLEMTLFYVHADGEIVTEASRRQDRYLPGSPAPYWIPYRWMARHDGNGRFAAMARWIERLAADRLTGNLIAFLDDPGLRDELPADRPLPEDFERQFEHSDLVRIRRGATSATILADNPQFFSLHKGSAAVVVRCATAFFGKGQFVGEQLRKDGGSWLLEQRLTGPYYQPLPPQHRTGSGDWSKMPRELRGRSEVQTLHANLRITEIAGGFEITFDIDGTRHVPVAVELGFRPGGELEGVERVAAGSFLLPGGKGSYRFGDDRIDFGPGRVAHRWLELRGALPKLQAESVYVTGNTPFRFELRLS